MKYNYLTIERGKGQTYSQSENGVTVYGFSVYKKGSVLEGQEMRCWLRSFKESEARNDNVAAAYKWCAENHPGVEVDCLLEGTSYVPHEKLVAHLPDDDDW